MNLFELTFFISGAFALMASINTFVRIGWAAGRFLLRASSAVVVMVVLVEGAAWQYLSVNPDWLMMVTVQAVVVLVAPRKALQVIMRMRLRRNTRVVNSVVETEARTSLIPTLELEAHASFDDRNRPYIALSWGMVSRDLDQLWFVIGHELAHLKLQHVEQSSARREGHAFAAVGSLASGAIFGFFAGGPIGAIFGGVSGLLTGKATSNWIESGYSQDEEREADSMGALACIALDADLRKVEEFFLELAMESPDESAFGRTIERLRGRVEHPALEDRLDHIREINRLFRDHGRDAAIDELCSGSG